MFDTISQYIDKMPIWGWILTGIVVLILGIVSTPNETITSSEDEEDEEDDMTDIITCSVPWQEVIVFHPNQYSDYNVDHYDGYLDITMKNWNTCYLPIQYTTVIDKSFKSLPQA